MTYNINDIYEIDSILQNADANTVDTPYIINISQLTQTDVNGGHLRHCLKDNPTKYVIINFLSGPTVTDVSFFLGDFLPAITSLVGADISALTNVTKAENTFRGDTNLKSANISGLNKLTEATRCFDGCTSLETVNCTGLTSLTNAAFMFCSCTSLAEVDTSSFIEVIFADTMFSHCTSLEEIDASYFIKVQHAQYMFTGCSSLTEVDVSAMTSIVYLYVMFAGCTNLEKVILPTLSSVSGGAMYVFQGCSSLVEIHNWTIPISAGLSECFDGCTSLQAIYVPEVVPQESTWHAWDIKKDTANTRSDVTIYGTSGTPVTVQIPSSGTYSLEVSGMTDELLFSSTKAITSAHIQKMMQTQTPITGNTDALDPTKDNFVMLAKDRTAAKTNVTTDVVEAGNLLPPTSAAVHAAIDANKSGGIPLGGWTSFENDTAPNTEWLQAGTTFDSDTYPELFLYLGGNTVPERYDHSRLSAYQSITLPTSSATAITMQYDGVLHYVPRSGSLCSVYINGTAIYADDGSSDAYGSATVSFKAGDIIYATVNGSQYSKVAYYTHPMFIKATTTASSYTPSSAVQEIKDYTKDYVDAKNSYSTNETLTGGTWVDGKPIYKNVVESSSFTTSSPLDISVPNLETLIDAKLKRNYDASHPNWWVFDGTTSSNNLIVDTSTAGHIVVTPQSTSITIKNFTGTFLYTKTTD